MEQQSSESQTETAAPVGIDQPVYEPPVVTRYTDEQLLEALGPAQARQYGPPG